MAEGILVNRLPEILKERTINLAALARKAKVSYPTMHALAKGQTQTIKKETLMKVLNALELESPTIIFEFVPNDKGNGDGKP